jgi:hypothetical protein
MGSDSSKIPRVQRRKEEEEESQNPNSLKYPGSNRPSFKKSNSFSAMEMGKQASQRHAKNNASIHNRNQQLDIDCDDRHLSFKVDFHVDWAEQAKLDLLYFMLNHGITAESHIFHVVDCHGSPYEKKSGEEVFPLRFVFRRKAI